MKTKDLCDYRFDITVYQNLTKPVDGMILPSHIIDEMIRIVMTHYHDTNTNENIKNPSFLMAWNTLTQLGLYKKLDNKTVNS